MSEVSVRPPPRVIRVPPPDVKRGVLLPRLVTIAVLATVSFIFGESNHWDDSLFLGFIAIATGGVVMLWLRSCMIQKVVRQMQQLVYSHALEWDSDPIAVKVSQIWESPTLAPDASEIEEITPTFQDHANIVCLGGVDVPAVNERRFEPVVITPLQHWREIMAATLMGGLLLLAMCYIVLLFVEAFLDVQVTGILLVFPLLLATVYALSRLVIRPTYIRLAPGIVQVLRYGLMKNKPSITNFPMTGGTLVVVDDAISLRGSRRLTLAFLRDGTDIRFPVWRFSNRQEIMGSVWQALLSTAPTPPLSDEDLVG